MDIKINMPEKSARELISDIVPKMINASNTSGHELLIEMHETKDKVKKKKASFHDGKKKMTKKGSKIVIAGRHSEVTLDSKDIKKLKSII